jgi:hypothetical protein
VKLLAQVLWPLLSDCHMEAGHSSVELIFRFDLSVGAVAITSIALTMSASFPNIENGHYNARNRHIK